MRETTFVRSDNVRATIRLEVGPPPLAGPGTVRARLAPARRRIAIESFARPLRPVPACGAAGPTCRIDGRPDQGDGHPIPDTPEPVLGRSRPSRTGRPDAPVADERTGSSQV